MKRFTIKRLNLKHGAQFNLRSHTSLSQSIISTHRDLTVANAPVASDSSYMEFAYQVAAQTLIASLIATAPFAEAHAKKKPKVVSIVFEAQESAPRQPASTVKKADGNIKRTLRPVDRYSDDSTDAVVEADIADGDGTVAAAATDELEPIAKSKASKAEENAVMLPKVKKAPRPEATMIEELAEVPVPDFSVQDPSVKDDSQAASQTSLVHAPSTRVSEVPPLIEDLTVTSELDQLDDYF